MIHQGLWLKGSESIWIDEVETLVIEPLLEDERESMGISTEISYRIVVELSYRLALETQIGAHSRSR